MADVAAAMATAILQLAQETMTFPTLAHAPTLSMQ